MSAISKGFVLATAAASLFISAMSYATDNTSTQSDKAKPVKCYGINKCRGHGQCGAKNSHACAGLNSCKGKGWVFLKTSQECVSKGGKPE